MKISVRQNHIDEGVRDSSNSCPIALAASEAFAWPVNTGRVQLSCNGVSYWLPSQVRGAIIAFDATGQMQPFEFELEEEKVVQL